MKKVLVRIVLMLVERIEKGETQEELMNGLPVKISMDIRDAKDFLEQVQNTIKN